MVDTRYADCEGCGERYHGADIERNMREVHREETDSWEWWCQRCYHKEFHGVTLEDG